MKLLVKLCKQLKEYEKNHAQSILGQENIPDSGPALILYYHGAIPVDYFYLVADTFLKKQRLVEVKTRIIFFVNC